MERTPSTVRANWQTRVEEQGFVFHTADEQPYWDESACYRFTPSEIDTIEAASYALDKMCLEAVQFVIDSNLYELFAIPAAFRPWIAQSWDRDEHTIYGRFDLAFDGRSPPKMLEYNADTPTSLLEASVIQWTWLKDVHPNLDQFNSVHERLIEAWKPWAGCRVHFSAIDDSAEDAMTTHYLRDVATQAGVKTTYLPVDRIGLRQADGAFVDETNLPIETCFKLYPWEWMTGEKFGPKLLTAATRWLEPPWKMLLSNKALLAVLWQLFPKSPFLLETAFSPIEGSYVRKPLLSREGANVTIMQNGSTIAETPGAYKAPYVFQRYSPLPVFAGNRPVIGSWMVNGYACGIGIREDDGLVTGNTSRFVPHVIA